MHDAQRAVETTGNGSRSKPRLSSEGPCQTGRGSAAVSDGLRWVNRNDARMSWHEFCSGGTTASSRASRRSSMIRRVRLPAGNAEGISMPRHGAHFQRCAQARSTTRRRAKVCVAVLAATDPH